MASLVLAPLTKPLILPFGSSIRPQRKLNPRRVLNTGFGCEKTDERPLKKGVICQRFLTWSNRDYRSKVFALSDGNYVGSEEALTNHAKIPLSDVVMTRRRRVFWGRKWAPSDIATASVVLAVHLLGLFAPFKFSWAAFWNAFVLYLVTGLLGITLSFHRNLSHRSFKLPKWLEYTFAYCGVLALQGNPIDWVSTHRYHHQFCDSERDPHSPVDGFYYSHMGWLFDTKSTAERCGLTDNVGDLENQPFYKFFETHTSYTQSPWELFSMLLVASLSWFGEWVCGPFGYITLLGLLIQHAMYGADRHGTLVISPETTGTAGIRLSVDFERELELELETSQG